MPGIECSEFRRDFENGPVLLAQNINITAWSGKFASLVVSLLSWKFIIL